MSIWAYVSGRLKIEYLEVAKEIVRKSSPFPLQEMSNVKIIENQFFKGSEGGLSFFLNEQETNLTFDGNLRDCEKIEPLEKGFCDLIKAVRGIGFATIKIEYAGFYILEFYPGKYYYRYFDEIHLDKQFIPDPEIKFFDMVKR